MKTVYNLEYKILDKLGRQKSSHHVGVFDTLEKVEEKKKELYHLNHIIFEVYTIEHLFS